MVKASPYCFDITPNDGFQPVLRSLSAMDRRALRTELERLRVIAIQPFANKAEGLAWGNQVAPLLRFNPDYAANFSTALDQVALLHRDSPIRLRWDFMIGILDRAIADLGYQEAGLAGTLAPIEPYIAPSRIEELTRLSAPQFDLAKLLELLRELEACHRQACYFAIAALVRTILDHVPPIFGFRTFAEVAANYGGGRSFKDSMIRLQESARTIADQHLHAPIRAREVIPAFPQVDFRPELDLLLAEIVRKLKP
jgi:hypothetical protein